MAGRDQGHQVKVPQAMKQLVDQSAHFIAAMLILLPLALSTGVVSFAAAGLEMGIIREATEKGPITSKGSLLDMMFWLLGGLAAGAIYQCLQN